MYVAVIPILVVVPTVELAVALANSGNDRTS